jgi:hypothetical protein
MVKGPFKRRLIHLGTVWDIAAPCLGVELRARLALALRRRFGGCAAVGFLGRPAPFRFVLICLSAPFLCSGIPQIGGILFGALVFRGAGLVQRDRYCLPRIF